MILGPEPPGEPPDSDERAADVGRLVRRVVLGVVGVFVLIAILARTFREPLRLWGEWFVERFGMFGLFAGTFIADAFSCPIPPHVYMMAAVTSGRPQLPSIALIGVTSVLAGMTGYRMATHLGRVRLFRRLLERTRGPVDRLFERWGPWAILVAGISPLPYSSLCYTAGFYRLPWRYFGAFLALRIPRLLLFYAALRAGWSL